MLSKARLVASFMISDRGHRTEREELPYGHLPIISQWEAEHRQDNRWAGQEDGGYQAAGHLLAIEIADRPVLRAVRGSQSPGSGDRQQIPEAHERP